MNLSPNVPLEADSAASEALRYASARRHDKGLGMHQQAVYNEANMYSQRV